MEKKFSRTYSAKDITIITGLAALGAILIILPTSTSINTLGFFMLSAGIILSIFMKTGYKDTETGIRYNKKEHYYPSSQREILTKGLSEHKIKTDLQKDGGGNSLRLDIYHSCKSGKAYIQLFEYVPYKYEPCTIMYEDDIDNLSGLIK